MIQLDDLNETLIAFIFFFRGKPAKVNEQDNELTQGVSTGKFIKF